jgi:tRNA threonylcarbamoyladenosine biosynthesis protein TsaB
VLLLALDTATAVSAAALLEDQRLLGEVGQPSRSHSRTLLLAIDELMTGCRRERRELSGIAVGIGPGSFTGVRIGLTLAKTLAFALQIPLLGVSTLRALAENARASEPTPRGNDEICVALDALKGEVFCARFAERGADLEVLQAEAARHPAVWAQELAAGQGARLLLGSGALRYADLLREALGPRAVIPEGDDPHRIRAEAVGRLGLLRLRRGEADDPRTLEPLYCRLSEAELGKHLTPQLVPEITRVPPSLKGRGPGG